MKSMIGLSRICFGRLSPTVVKDFRAATLAESA